MLSYTVTELGDGAAAAERWDAFVDACPDATFFHRAGWKTVIERSFRQPCHFLMAERGGEIQGILPLVLVRSRLFGTRLVSTGWGVAGGAVVAEDAATAALDAAADALLRNTRAAYIEIRDPARPHATWPKKDGLYATFDRAIEADEDACLKQIPRKQRAVVRKALTSTDLGWRRDDDVDLCWSLFALGMRNLGTPVFGREYFRHLKDVFGDDCDVLTVFDQGRPVSSVLNFYFRDRVMPFYTGADPIARGTGAADLMYWRLMREAAEHGYRVFDFGRSKVDTGPFAFKKNWGFEPRPVLHEFRLAAGQAMPDVNPNNPRYARLIAAWKRLPLPVANAIGPWIGRQVG
ncbi:MAG: FemAB family PEP-CTERM system-associated protein [Caenispirillum bisanense]|nr:FemAB family PEP-CTERM system-associated protein [Caenispirillum bisanense]MCA1973338.1 FemAB family PEP-CTERM system-associated protein [Caenispirillum sp.]